MKWMEFSVALRGSHVIYWDTIKGPFDGTVVRNKKIPVVLFCHNSYNWVQIQVKYLNYDKDLLLTGIRFHIPQLRLLSK